MKKTAPARDAAKSDRISRKVENRRKLLAAARKLFIERGANEITTFDIAEQAGVVHGTFYNHFKDKTDCYLALIDDVEQELAQVNEWLYESEGAPADVISSWLSAMFSYSKANPGVLNAIFADFEVLSRSHERVPRKYPVLFKRLELLEKWKKTGKAAADFDTEYFLALMKGVIKHGISVIDREPDQEERVVREMTKFLVRSIKAD